MTCHEVDALLPAYLDGELDVASSLALEAHVAACSACTAALARAEALRDALGAAGLRYSAPPGLSARVREAIRNESRPRATATSRIRRWSALPIAAAIAAMVSWVAVANLGGGADRRLADELVAAHVRSLMVDHLVDVASTDQHTVRPWFNGKIDFAPPVADYEASGFPLVGGRVDYVGGRPVAALVYRHRQHVINVFIWPTAHGDARPVARSVQGYHLLRWSDRGLEYWAVSDLDAHELETLTEQIRRGINASLPAS